MSNQAHNNAIQGGLQGWSVKAPYPFIVMAVDNPQGMPEGLYWYVVDSRKGSHAFKDREGNACKGPTAAEYAHAHASALYRHEILKEDRMEAAKEYKTWWAKVRYVEHHNEVFTVIAVNPFAE